MCVWFKRSTTKSVNQEELSHLVNVLLSLKLLCLLQYNGTVHTVTSLIPIVLIYSYHLGFVLIIDNDCDIDIRTGSANWEAADTDYCLLRSKTLTLTAWVGSRTCGRSLQRKHTVL
jgi:hypothetical protein